MERCPICNVEDCKTPAHQDIPIASLDAESINDAIHEAGAIVASRLSRDPEWTTPRYRSLKDVLGAVAMWAVRQSPYACPDDLDRVLCALAVAIGPRFPESLPAQHSLLAIEAMLRDHLLPMPQVAAWNERKNGRDGPGFCSAFSEPTPDDDFIDLDALVRNVAVQLRDEDRRWDAFNADFERSQATQQ